MEIQSNRSYNVSMNGYTDSAKRGWRTVKTSVKQKVLDLFPSATIKDSEKQIKKAKKFNEILSKPAENRLIVGGTALLTQPAIDYYNHRVDEETRTISRNRTIAKILAGTAVGVLVRGWCYNIVNKMTDTNSSSKYSKYLIPEKFAEKLKNAEYLKNHKSALATCIALGIMSITNFILDAPLTTFLTNLMNSRYLADKKAKGGTNEKIS